MNIPFLLFWSISLLLFTGSCKKSHDNQTNDTVIQDTVGQYIAPQALNTRLPLDKIKLPKGFAISMFKDSVKGARSLCRGDKGTIFVGTRAGEVYALVDANGDGWAEKTITIAKGLNTPNGVAFKDGSLYVAEISRIIRFDDIEQNLENPGPYVVVNNKFPTDQAHGWKYIAFGPDGKLYVPVGAPCNICETDSMHGNIMRMNKDGSQLEVFAKGVRNSVGFDWQPQTNVLFFTDNGRDQMGDDIPDDELNKAPNKGMHFGFPYCHQGDVKDPKYNNRDCSEFTPPVQKLGPHVAALGMKFYTGKLFPTSYLHSIFIAQHGSWNRSEKIGYRVMNVAMDGEKVVRYDVFAEGWLEAGKVWGRPVDILQLPDGSLLISDDYADAVYRITYKS